MTDVKQISKKDFENGRLKISTFCIVECYSNSFACMQIMEPILDKIKIEFDSSISHYRICTKENPFLISLFRIVKEPTYLFFYNGEIIYKAEGLMSFQILHNTINDLITKI